MKTGHPSQDKQLELDFDNGHPADVAPYPVETTQANVISFAVKSAQKQKDLEAKAVDWLLRAAKEIPW